MKKILAMTSLIIGLVMFSFAFTACSNDDDDNSSSNPLVGKWVTTEYGARDILEFKSNGTGYFIWNSDGGEREDFTYTYDASKIYFIFAGGVDHDEDYYFEGENLVIDEVWIKQ